MLEKYSRYRVLKVFLDSPTEQFGLREISRKAHLSPPSVMNYLGEFEKDGLIEKIQNKDNPAYRAVRDNDNFKLYKKISIVYEIGVSGLAEFLWKKLSPEAIILFGSHAKGEAIESSDLDLFIIGKEAKIDLSSFEKKLGKKVHILFEPRLEDIPKELRNNVINGIILKGYVKVF